MSPAHRHPIPQGEDGEGEGASPLGWGHPGRASSSGGGRGHAEGAAALPAPHVRGEGCARGIGDCSPPGTESQGDMGDRSAQSCVGTSEPVLIFNTKAPVCCGGPLSIPIPLCPCMVPAQGSPSHPHIEVPVGCSSKWHPWCPTMVAWGFLPCPPTPSLGGIWVKSELFG